MVERGKPIYIRKKVQRVEPTPRPAGTQEWKSAVLSAERERSVAEAEAETDKSTK
jgi:hypothetical protein